MGAITGGEKMSPTCLAVWTQYQIVMMEHVQADR